MPTDLLTGKTEVAQGPADLMAPVDTFTDNLSQTDTPEKNQDLMAKAEQADMPNDKAFLYEQTKDKSSWGATIDVFGRAISRLPADLASGVLKLSSGINAASVTDKDWRTNTLRKANEKSDAFSQSIYKQYGDTQIAPGVPIKLTDVAALPQSMSFSLISMGVGVATGVPVALIPLPGARVAAFATGATASGKAAYEMATYEIMQTYLETLNDEEALTPETERSAKAYFNAAAQQYGLWEAVPEAVSNLAFASILTKPLTKMVGKTVAGKIVQKIGGLYGEEMITEAVTQYGQARIEEEYGMREPGEGQISPWQALKEVAPQTFLLTTIMGGAGAGAVAVSKKAKESFSKETKGKNIAPAKLQQAIKELDGRVNDVNKAQGKAIQQQALMTKDSMEGKIGWIDYEGDYHSANETKPLDSLAADGSENFIATPKDLEFAKKTLEKNNEGRKLSDREKFAQGWFLGNFQQAINRYIMRSRLEFGGAGNVISSDIGKFAIPGMTAERSADYHETGSAIKDVVEQYLYADPRTAGKPVGFTAGGSGSGKSSILRSTMDVKNDFALVYDTNLNGYRSAKKKVDKALASGRPVYITGVFREFIDSYENGVIPRVATQDRIVPLLNHYETHAGWVEVLKKLREDFGDQITIDTVDNSRGKNEHAHVELDAVSDPRYNLNEGEGVALAHILYAKLEGALESGKITREHFRTAIKGVESLEKRSQQEGKSTPKPILKRPAGRDTAGVQKKPVKRKPKKYPQVIRNAVSRIKAFQERLKEPDIKKRKDVETERKSVSDFLNRSKLLPLYPRRRMVEAINKMQGISTAAGRERFSKLLDSVIEQIELVQKKQDLKEDISARKLQRVDNLRKAAKLPAIKKMTAKQLDEFVKMLEPYQHGDVFLSQRQIETVDNTDLSGIRTRREAQERLAKEAGVPIEELTTIKVSWMDKFRQDVRLRERNPLYKLLIEGSHAAFLKGDLAFREFERKLNDLTNKARKSKKKSFLDVLIPTDELVFNYLSSENKTEIEAEMSKEELELALFLQDEYAKALKYLIEQQTLKTGLDNYITNVRRGFMEGLKQGGLKTAFKEMFDSQKADEQVFNILDQDTGMILPLEKFFQFSMKRTGNINPTKNVAKASSIYFQTFYKKNALDATIPKMMIFVQAMTPMKETERGLEYDRSIQKFVKTWINTKKGRKSVLYMPQGGKLDIAVTTLKTLITIWDLGINIPVQIAATIGEASAGYVTLGKARYAKGIARIATKKGRDFANKYEGFTGKTIWQELWEPAKHIGDKFMTAIMGGFAASSTRMNKISLLGMVTNEEYNSGEVSDKRLAQMKLEIGKMRVISGGKSIWGSTTAGSVGMQYKTWALPIMATVSSDFINLSKKLKEGKAKWNSEEAVRIRREAEILLAALGVFALIGVDDDDRSFLGQLMVKAQREAFTIMGALDPSMWLGTPRMIQWLGNIGLTIKQILTLEKYKSEGREEELKGVTRAARIITPRAISMFIPEETGKKIGQVR